MEIKEFIWDLSDYTGWAEREDEYDDVAVFMSNMLNTIKRIRTEDTMAAYIEWQANRIERCLNGTQSTTQTTESLHVMKYIMKIIQFKFKHIRHED